MEKTEKSEHGKRVLVHGKKRVVRCNCSDPDVLIRLIRENDDCVNRGYFFRHEKLLRSCPVCGYSYFYIPTKKEQREQIDQTTGRPLRKRLSDDDV